MKNKVAIIAFLCLLSLTSCGESGPGDAFMKYAGKAINGHFDELAKECLILVDTLEVTNDSLAIQLMDSYKKDLELKFLGVKSAEVLQDSVYENGQKADIRVRLKFGNGQEEETEYEMRKVDGSWKINLSL